MRKLIAILLCVVLLAACCVPALAAGEETKYADALKTLGLFQGTDKGYELEKTLTREQGVVMIIRLLGEEGKALAADKTHPFADIDNYPWFAPYAAYARNKGITNGVSDTKFGYGMEMTEAMFLTMLLRVLGYKDSTNDTKGDFVWDDPFGLAEKCKIAANRKEGAFTRETMTDRCWNTLSASFKDSEKTLSAKLIEDGVFTNAQFLAATTGVSGTVTESTGSTGTESSTSTNSGSSTSGSTSGSGTGSSTGGSTSGSTSGSGTGSSTGGSTSGSTGSGDSAEDNGTGSGNTSSNPLSPEEAKPQKPNETPRLPMP